MDKHLIEELTVDSKVLDTSSITQTESDAVSRFLNDAFKPARPVPREQLNPSPFPFPVPPPRPRPPRPVSLEDFDVPSNDSVKNLLDCLKLEEEKQLLPKPKKEPIADNEESNNPKEQRKSLDK